MDPTRKMYKERLIEYDKLSKKQFLEKQKRHDVFKDEKITFEKAHRSQEKWRQKQLDIYYRNGRPIFQKDEHKIKFYSLF